ncbi:hypothetical protein [Flocculibacter collagenilyticus]|uniref:hypothetical protein n=1 Tax=Flocculibacter collagenilyticus TaxID=2744479 RepID=UPI0018F2B28B|nr:hypothetical protein [Flocculibacter collagenilyticus]
MIKTITTATLLVGSLLTATAPAMAESHIKNFRQVVPHPTYGTDTWVQVVVQSIEKRDSSPYPDPAGNIVEDYENSFDGQLRPIEAGKQMINIKCLVNTGVNYQDFTPLRSTSISGGTTLTLEVEEGVEYELYPDLFHFKRGWYDTAHCIPGIKINR